MIKRVNRPSTRARWRKETVSNSFCVDFYSKRVDLFSKACCFQKASNSVCLAWQQVLLRTFRLMRLLRLLWVQSPAIMTHFLDYFFQRAKMYYRSLACLRDCSRCFIVIFVVTFQFFFLYFLNALLSDNNLIIIVTQC